MPDCFCFAQVKTTKDYADLDIAGMVRTVAAHFDAFASELLRAQVDPEKVERVLLNLLSTAFKFSPRAGESNAL
jgi:signal transduction histidine kinase